jgi:hypothetical protein
MTDCPSLLSQSQYAVYTFYEVKLKNISWLKSTEINCIFTEYLSAPIKA